jgi:DNA polymerase
LSEHDERVRDGIRRHLEWEVAAGRRHVIDGELRTLLEGGATAAATAATTAAPTAPPTAPPTASPLVAPAAPEAAASPEEAADAPASRGVERSALDPAHRAEQLAGLASKASGCTRCPLHGTRHNVVFGAGNPDADLMFIGEAPGRDEDLEGAPFVGRAGQLLTRIIEAIHLTREAVYIANVLKCRPPENRNPNGTEIALCSPFLYEQIDWVAPRVICALGRFACMTLLKSSSPLGRMRGRVHRFRDVPVVVTYHPAALLRYQNLKRPTWEDMQRVQKILAGEMPPNWG